MGPIGHDQEDSRHPDLTRDIPIRAGSISDLEESDKATVSDISPSIDVSSGSEFVELRHDSTPAHPLDPLSSSEIRRSVQLIRDHFKIGILKFNFITLSEPSKAEYSRFRAGTSGCPPRKAFAVILENGTAEVCEVLVNLSKSRVESYKHVDDVAAMLTPEDLEFGERLARKDPSVIQACKQIGITDMSKVYLDFWAIGFDHRWNFDHRLSQGWAYYRSFPDDNQYAYPLDFCVIVDTEKQEILAVDIKFVNGERVKPSLPQQDNTSTTQPISGLEVSELADWLKPIEINQPQGTSFSFKGNEVTWAGYRMHIGFNYREGIVLSDITINDRDERRERSLFRRLSVAEMVVPYGHPESPYHRKHAFDFGEYGMGLMTNSLKLGCDCKGEIRYMDAVFSNREGEPSVIKNAICVHEEDNGILYKHTDERNRHSVIARDRKLIISQIATAANYEYAFYHIFTLDGTYKLEVRLTGMLSTHCLHRSESASPYGTEVAPRVSAHNHQHIFSLRVDPEIDGFNNTVVQCDAVPSPHRNGSSENPFGNAFVCEKRALRTSAEYPFNYCHETGRTWDIINPNRINPTSHRPVGYKILNNNCPPLLAQPDSMVWKRARFTHQSLWVVPYNEGELYPAGNYVCQSGGHEKHPDNMTVADWASRNGSIENTDIVCFIQFGLTHFPRTEDFPIMPAEPVSVTLRASSFFATNPAVWVPAKTSSGNVQNRAD